MDTATWLNDQLRIHNINAQGLSHAIGVSHVTVGKWVKGTYTPNPANCQKLARFFHIPEDDILIIAGHKSPHVIGDNTPQVKEPSPKYGRSGAAPRLARLVPLIEHFTEDQVERLIAFLEAIK